MPMSPKEAKEAAREAAMVYREVCSMLSYGDYNDSNNKYEVAATLANGILARRLEVTRKDV